MRNLVLKDKLIDKDECLALLDEYGEFIKDHTGIEPVFWVEQRDFTFVPTTPDSDGDLKPTREYRKQIETEVHKRYGDYGVDNIIMLVHENNFNFKGIWGTNWSYNFFKYSFQLCRWDKDNPANSFGTLYHEQMHSFDSVIIKETGVQVDPMFGVHWDQIVHGIGDWDYIRYKENTDALEMISYKLEEAYSIRKEKHTRYTDLLKRIITLLQNLVKLLKK